MRLLSSRHHDPGQQVIRFGDAEVGQGVHDRGARRGQGGQHPAEPARAEQRGQPGGQDHDRPAGQRRADPDRRRIDPEHVRDSGEQRGERRLVDVAEREVVSRHDEVQLVLQEAVAAAQRELGRDEHRRDDPHRDRHPIAGRGWWPP